MRIDPVWLSLYFHTAWNMQPRQLVGIAARKAREALLPRLPVDFDARYERQVPASPTLTLDPVAGALRAIRESLAAETRRRHRDLALSAADGELTFLSHTVSFPDGIDWDDDRLMAQQELWWELLFGFTPLRWLVMGAESPAAARGAVEAYDGWLDDWIRSAGIEKPGYLRGRWTPYCVSLRVRYWLQYLAWRWDAEEEAPLDGALARETYKNALFLSNHVEWEIGGNHLVENGGSLVLAGIVFGEPDWRRQGLDVLTRASRTQFLADGGHFELSPMYHVAVLVQYLMTCDLLDRTDHEVPEPVRRAARAGTAFLRFLSLPDGRIPLLNDAVHGYTLSLSACSDYASTVNLGDGPARGWGAESTGYRWFRNDTGTMLVDGGPVGPRHIPAHSHNDLLSVLLWVKGHPVATDTGVYSYEGETRQYARSVRAHNTVQVGDGEPIPIGGKYLMGRRTRPETRTDSSDGVALFEGWYKGHPMGGPVYRHHREVRTGEDRWTVWDRVDVESPEHIRSRLHLHPAIDVRKGDPLRLDVPDASTIRVYPLGDATATVGESPYFPRFGERCKRPMMTLDAGNGSQARFGVFLTPRSDGGVSTGLTGNVLPVELR